MACVNSPKSTMQTQPQYITRARGQGSLGPLPPVLEHVFEGFLKGYLWPPACSSLELSEVCTEDLGVGGSHPRRVWLHADSDGAQANQRVQHAPNFPGD